MSFRNYAVHRNEQKKPSSTLLSISGPVETNRDSKHSIDAGHAAHPERLPIDTTTTSKKTVPLLVTGTQITTCNELHLVRRTRKAPPNRPRLEERTLSLPKILHHPSSSDGSSFKTGSTTTIPNGSSNPSGSTSVKRTSNDDRKFSSLRENSFKLDSAACSQDQRSFFQTSSIKCLPSDGKSSVSRYRTSSMPSTIKKSAIFPSLQIGTELKPELNFDLGKNIVQTSQGSNNKVASFSDHALERRRLDGLNRSGGEETERKESKEGTIDTRMGDCSLDDLSNAFVDRIMTRTMTALEIKKAFDQVWPPFLHNFVQETLRDFENMPEHMKAYSASVMENS